MRRGEHASITYRWEPADPDYEEDDADEILSSPSHDIPEYDENAVEASWEKEDVIEKPTKIPPQFVVKIKKLTKAVSAPQSQPPSKKKVLVLGRPKGNPPEIKTPALIIGSMTPESKESQPTKVQQSDTPKLTLHTSAPLKNSVTPRPYSVSPNSSGETTPIASQPWRRKDRYAIPRDDTPVQT